MKKLLLTITCCITFLLCIPFNTLAIQYEGQLSALEQITELQLSKINELVNSHNTENLIIYYSYETHNLSWSYDIKSYRADANLYMIAERFALTQDGTISSKSDEIPIYADGQYYVVYAYYNNTEYFNIPDQINYSSDENTLLFTSIYDNVVRTRTSSFVTSSQTRYYSTVDYDITHIIKGTNFDVYYLVNGSYKLIQKSVNTFTIINHDSKTKFKDSTNPNAYPDYPSVPSDSAITYENQFSHGNFLFKISELNTNNLIVKAPDTDSLISDGNSISQSATSNNEQSNQLLDNTINQMESLENGFKNDLNSNLDNINSNNFNISGITQLSNAASFVRVQFDNLTKNNPFGTILGFSLFLGLSLLIIGKRL